MPVQPVFIREEHKPEVPKRQPELPSKPEVETSKPAKLEVPPADVKAKELTPVKEPEPNNSEPAKTIPGNQQEFPEKNSETIPREPESELFGGAKPKRTKELAPYSKRGRVGRQRKYDEMGNRGESPIRDVVLYRYIKKRHWPGLSRDMQEWYEWFYFTEPNNSEGAFHGKDYEQHCRAYERGQKWIEAYSASLGDSRVIDLQKRRAAN